MRGIAKRGPHPNGGHAPGRPAGHLAAAHPRLIPADVRPRRCPSSPVMRIRPRNAETARGT
eukprot:2374253-Prymnesium_polylepis.1